MKYTDSTYLEAKKVKEGAKKLPNELELLGEFLKNEFSAILLNADIYIQPVFKTLDPSLRLIIDNEVKNTNLPIYYLDRNKIRDKFMSICKEFNSDLAKDLIDDKLSVDYVEFDELLFRETKSNLNHSEIMGFIDESSILRMINYFSEFIFFFEDKQTVETHIKKDLPMVIKNKIIKLIRDRGYDGTHLSDISVRFDTIDSFEKAGSEYNYLR